ncbi:hypothetical protein C4M96_02155 [Mycoplasmopsis pullorum]|nr:hypothetical protein C4M93_03945 [Mycoplasmopsis pullorum]TNK92096.1 hypothetical protein C4M96_02155 [Mycoplasmopsis pullorum]
MIFPLNCINKNNFLILKIYIIVSVINTILARLVLNNIKFLVAIHILIMLSESPDKLTSEKIAKSINNNPSFVRKIITLLVKANVIQKSISSNGYTLNKVANGRSRKNNLKTFIKLAVPGDNFKK